jgi:GT2 family glycosyltransferase
MLCEPIKVTVGIVTRNRPQHVQQALESVFMQDYRPLEVMVVDNASEPSIIPLVAPDGIKLHWMRYEENMGPLVARNNMMAKAIGQYFVSLDDDAFFTDRQDLTKAVAFLETNGQVAVLTFRMIDPQKPIDNNPNPRPVVSFLEGCHILRLSVLKKTGFYREIFSFASDGLDLSYRIWEVGYQIYYFPKVTVVHERTQEGRSWGSWEWQSIYQIRNAYLIYFLNQPFPWIVPFTLLHAFNSIRKNIQRRTLFLALKGLVYAIKEYRSLKKERNPVSKKTMGIIMNLNKNRF